MEYFPFCISVAFFRVCVVVFFVLVHAFVVSLCLFFIHLFFTSFFFFFFSFSFILVLILVSCFYLFFFSFIWVITCMMFLVSHFLSFVAITAITVLLPLSFGKYTPSIFFHLPLTKVLKIKKTGKIKILKIHKTPTPIASAPPSTLYTPPPF